VIEPALRRGIAMLYASHADYIVVGEMLILSPWL